MVLDERLVCDVLALLDIVLVCNKGVSPDIGLV